MIIENIRKELENHINKSDILKIGYIKEYLQTIILKQIYEMEVSRNLIFYGGTSLRFLFGLNRLSEDLDFISKDFEDFEKLGENLQNYFKMDNIEIICKLQKFRIILTFKDFLSYFGLSYGNSKDLYIKIEISDHFSFCQKFEIKIYPIFKFNQSLVIKSLDKSSLFSTKLNAVLYRKWEKQTKDNKISVKGRDIYDLFRYLSNGFKPNINCISQISDMNELKHQLKNVVENIDFNEVVLDIENFVEDHNIVNFIKTDGKTYILEKIDEL